MIRSQILECPYWLRRFQSGARGGALGILEVRADARAVRADVKAIELDVHHLANDVTAIELDIFNGEADVAVK